MSKYALNLDNIVSFITKNENSLKETEILDVYDINNESAKLSNKQIRELHNACTDQIQTIKYDLFKLLLSALSDNNDDLVKICFNTLLVNDFLIEIND